MAVVLLPLERVLFSKTMACIRAEGQNPLEKGKTWLHIVPLVTNWAVPPPVLLLSLCYYLRCSLPVFCCTAVLLGLLQSCFPLLAEDKVVLLLQIPSNGLSATSWTASACKTTKRHKKYSALVYPHLCALEDPLGPFLHTQTYLLASERQPHIQGSSEPVLAHLLQAPSIAAAFCALLCSPAPRSCWVTGMFTSVLQWDLEERLLTS